MTRINLFTKEEIEKCGLTYEPDVSKCKCGHRVHVMFVTFYVKDGIVEYGEPGISKDYSKDYDKQWIGKYIPVKYIHSIYVDIFDQADQNELNHWNKNYHGHIWIKVCGHTPFTDEELDKIK